MSEEAQNIDVEITEEKIEKAALPENRRVEEEVQDTVNCRGRGQSRSSTCI